MDTTNVSWNERMADALAELGAITGDSRAVVVLALEAAGELKAARLKILLGRCWEVIAIAKSSAEEPNVTDGFLDEVLEATK